MSGRDVRFILQKTHRRTFFYKVNYVPLGVLTVFWFYTLINQTQ